MKKYKKYVKNTEREVKKYIDILEKQFKDFRRKLAYDRYFDGIDETTISKYIIKEMISIDKNKKELSKILESAQNTVRKVIENNPYCNEDDYYIAYLDQFLNYAILTYNMFVTIFDYHEPEIASARKTLNNQRKNNATIQD